MTALAKVSYPRIGRVLRRSRLFRRLDTARKASVVWVQGPPGSGKTTLVASWLEARRIRSLWYNVDEGDADLATFFYYLGIAGAKLGRRREPLPLLTPEYLGGVSTFARAYFRQLCARARPPFALVFDDYQAVPSDSPFHDVMRNALAEVPENVTAILLARGDPPPAFARMRANDDVALLGGPELELTPQEARGIAALRGAGRLAPHVVESLRKRSGGWAAGLVLMLAKGGSSMHLSDSPWSPSQIFDYFASEIFARADGQTHTVLLETALLPKVTAPLAMQVTGIAAAPRILSDLARQGYFTVRTDGPDAGYRYHPLFRDFLLSRGREELPPQRSVEVQLAAARLLAQQGQGEDAIGLLREAACWEAMAELVLKQAPSALQAGRGPTVARWIGDLPREIRDRDPWLLYWLGMAVFAMDPAGARRQLERAFAGFEETRDVTGLYLAWAAAVDTYIWEWADFSGLDRWIAEFERLRAAYPEFPTPEAAHRVSLDLFAALVFHRPDYPSLPRWEESAFEIALGQAPSPLRLAAGTYHVVYSGWLLGELPRAKQVVDVLAPLARAPGVDPRAAIFWYSAEAPYHLNAGSLEQSRRITREALALAEETGIHAWDLMLYLLDVWTSLSANDLREAAEGLRHLEGILDPARRLNLGMFEYTSALYALRAGNVDAAAARARSAIELNARAGLPFSLAFARVVMARVLISQGELSEAAEHLAAARRTAVASRSSFLHVGIDLIDSLLRFSRGDAAAVEVLRAGLGLAKNKGLFVHLLLSREDVGELCAHALEHGVEPEYARRLAVARGARPPQWAVHLESWPWPLEVRALGGLALRCGGEPLRISDTLPRKRLDLLKLLVCTGDRPVGVDTACDALWPDAEGDAAHHALETTLYRLRRLVGSQDAVVLRKGKISLDPLCCWVDVWALERLLADAVAALDRDGGDDSGEDAERIASLYRGPVLDGDDAPWAQLRRARLRRRLAVYLAALEHSSSSVASRQVSPDLRRRILVVDPAFDALRPRLASG